MRRRSWQTSSSRSWRGGSVPTGAIVSSVKGNRMYWRTGQYEVLRGRAAKDRDGIVRDALAKYGRATSRRFLFVVAWWVGGTIAGILHTRRSAVSDWKVWL